MCTNFFKQVCCVLSLSLMLSGCGGGASGGANSANVTTAISWAPQVYGTTDTSLYTGIVSAPPDNTTGGWNLATKTWTTAGSTADIVLGGWGRIGAVGIALSQAGFNTNPEPPLTYVTNLPITGAGDVFVLVLRNGKHAKLRIDSVTSNPPFTYGSVSFTYLLEQGSAATATPICSAPPTAPTGFAASQTAFGTVTSTWQPSAGATSYTLYSQGTPGVTTASSKHPITTWQTNAQGQASWTLANVPLGAYYGAMTATNPCGESVLSAEGGPTSVVTVAPSAPTLYTPTPGNTQAILSWAAQAGATSYNVYGSTAPGVAKLNPKFNTTTTGATGTGLVNGTTYYFVVTAVNSAGESAVSNEVSVIPYDPMVPQLNTLTKVGGIGASISVCLTDLSGGVASSWNVYRSVTPGVTVAPANLVSNNGLVWANAGSSHCFTDNTGITAGTTYYYRATSVSAAGAESTLSNELSIAF